MRKHRFMYATVALFASISLCTVNFGSACADEDSSSNPIKDNYWGDLVEYTYKKDVENFDNITNPTDEQTNTHSTAESAAHTLGKYYPANLLTPNESTLESLEPKINFAFIPSHSGILDTSKTYELPQSFDTLSSTFINSFDPKQRWYMDNSGNIQTTCQETQGSYTNRTCWNDPFNWTTDKDSQLIKTVDQLTIKADLAKSNNNGSTSGTNNSRYSTEISELNKGEKLNLDFSTDLSNYVKLHEAVTLQNFYNRDGTNKKSADNPNTTLGPTSQRASDWELTFTLELPKNVELGSDASYTVDGLTKDSYTITKEVDKNNNQKIYFKIRKKQPTGNYETASDYYKRLASLGKVTLHIKGITTDSAETDKNLTIVGKLAGMHDELMKYTTKGAELEPRNVEFFIAKQSDEGRDANAEKDKKGNLTKPNLITFTFKIKKPETYKVTYSFKSGTSEKSLPAEVTDLLPASTSGHANGENITPAQPSKTSVDIKDKDGKKLGTWNFAGWSPTSATINNADVYFVGTWNFTPVKEPNPGPNTPPIPDHPHDPETPNKPDTPVTPETPETPETPDSPDILSTPETTKNTERTGIPLTPKNSNKQQEELQTKQVSPEPNTGAAQTEKSENQQILAKTGVNTVFIAIFAIFIVLLAASLRKILPRQQIKHLR